MSNEIRLWKVGEDSKQLIDIPQSSLDLEERLEEWLERDISMISDDLLVIGRQVNTDFGGVIDLLCLDDTGDVVIVELKRDKTPRDITAQTIDYASWVNDLSHEDISGIANIYYQNNSRLTFEEEFKKKFDSDLPDILNQSHEMLIVAAQIDGASERIIDYLSDNYGVSINSVTFHYFENDAGDEYLSRVFQIQPDQVAYRTKKRLESKRKPNLTPEDLQLMANEAHHGDLYRQLVDELDIHFKQKPTRSSMAFYGKIGGRSLAIFSLDVTESSAESGLKFHVYFHRFIEYFNLDDQTALVLLPENSTETDIFPGSEEDYYAYEGYFQNEEQISHFLAGLSLDRKRK